MSQDLRDRVRAEALRRGFAPSTTGRALRTGRSGVIGLVLPDLSNPLFPAIAQAVERAAQAQGYGVLIADSQGEEDAQTAAVERLARQGADGLVVVPRRGTRVRPSPVPVAVIDAASNTENTISADHRDGGAQVIRHLVALGHRRVLIVGQSRVSHVQATRVAGMLDALPDAVSARTHWFEDGVLPSPADMRSAGLTAIATTSDLIALPLLTRLQAAGFRAPEDFAITGFDDDRFSALVAPGLTSVAQDMRRIAEGAIQSVIRRLDNQDSPDGAVIPMRLIVRGSTDPKFNKEIHHENTFDGG